MSKSRSGKTPSGNQNVQAIVQNAIIPGKFMESDWNELVEDETGEEFIFEIVNDIADSVCDKIFEKIIQTRVQPYTVFTAKQLLLDIIELEFLKNDTGEKNTEEHQSWIEDDEPNPCVTDSWAQGAVPVIPVDSTCTESGIISTLHEDSIVDDVQLQTSQQISENELERPDSSHSGSESTSSQEITVAKNDIETSQSYEPSAPIKTEENLSSPRISPQPPTQSKSDVKKKRPKKFKRYGGSLPNFQPITLTPVTENRPSPPPSHRNVNPSTILHSSESLLRTQHGRPPGVRDVIYDDKGNVIHVQKLNLDTLPNHRIRTKYKIVDLSKENEKKMRLTSKQMNKTTKQERNEKNNNVMNPLTNSTALLQRFYGMDSDVLNGLRTPLPPPMVDAIDVSEGVLIKEGGLSKQGPRLKYVNDVNKEESYLHPISSTSTRVLKVKDIVADLSPTIKPLNLSKPLPSIYS